MTGFTRRAVRRGGHVFSSSRAVLLAMLKHPFGIHDWVDELTYTSDDDGILIEMSTARVCWLCMARYFST